jgi:preprotein translocase subunit YajC
MEVGKVQGLQGWTFYIWIAVVFAFMYFFTIRPQQKEQRERVQMLRELKPGDKVVTHGGLVGVITKVEDLSVRVRVAERVEVEILKTGIARPIRD